jgi:hypothetical protein
MALLSRARDGTTMSFWRWCCRGDIGRGVMLLLSHVGNSDGAAKATLVVA